MHPNKGYKQLKSDFPSVWISIDDNDDNENDVENVWSLATSNNNNDVGNVGSALATSNNDEEDHDNNYGNNDDGKDTNKLVTTTSDEEDKIDHDSYDDEETGWDNHWCPVMLTLDWQKIDKNLSEKEASTR